MFFPTVVVFPPPEDAQINVDSWESRTLQKSSAEKPSNGQSRILSDLDIGGSFRGARLIKRASAPGLYGFGAAAGVTVSGKKTPGRITSRSFSSSHEKSRSSSFNGPLVVEALRGLRSMKKRFSINTPRWISTVAPVPSPGRPKYNAS